jgi:uncharacterized protein YqeY
MTTKDALNNALKESLKSGDDLQKNTVRMALAAIKQIEIDKRIVLDETGIASILQKEVKSRRESIMDAQKANRPETIITLEKEISILESFLPKQMDKFEIEAIVKNAIAELDAKTPADMGKVMKLVMTQVQGRASGDLISSVVREMLPK